MSTMEYFKELTLENSLAAVKQNGLALQYVLKQTPEICLTAVKQNGLAVQYVNKLNSEICKSAVKQNREAFQYVVENILLYNYNYFLDEIKHTKNVCLIAVRFFPNVLKHLKSQSIDICKEAIKNDPDSFEHVRNKNFKICKYALSIDGMLLDIIDLANFNPIKRDILIKTALSQNGLAIQYVNQTPEYCKIAYENNSRSLKLISLKIKKPFINCSPQTDDDCSICLSNDENEWCQLNCCTHKFHISCIKKIMKDNCPMCRKSFIIEFI
jgi:hypothetical protein